MKVCPPLDPGSVPGGFPGGFGVCPRWVWGLSPVGPVQGVWCWGMNQIHDAQSTHTPYSPHSPPIPLQGQSPGGPVDVDGVCPRWMGSVPGGWGLSPVDGVCPRWMGPVTGGRDMTRVNGGVLPLLG